MPHDPQLCSSTRPRREERREKKLTMFIPVVSREKGKFAKGKRARSVLIITFLSLPQPSQASPSFVSYDLVSSGPRNPNNQMAGTQSDARPFRTSEFANCNLPRVASSRPAPRTPSTQRPTPNTPSRRISSLLHSHFGLKSGVSSWNSYRGKMAENTLRASKVAKFLPKQVRGPALNECQAVE